MIALFSRYPVLAESLAHLSLGDFPTPVERAERLEAALGIGQFYAKREDLSGKAYGGNKIRALEFLLGDAVSRGDKLVWTAGFPASCQALAQAIYCREIGLKTRAFLFPQPPSEQGRRHLLAYLSIGAEVAPMPPFAWLLARRVREGKWPRLIEASSPLGMVGYVSSAFELKEQIERGLVPEPDLIYLMLATAGTMAGLQMGLRAAGLRSRVVGVCRARTPFNGPKRLAKLAAETNELLRARDPSFPALELREADFIIHQAAAPERGKLTNPRAAEAMSMARDLANLQLDEMFTANAFTALMSEAEMGNLKDKTVLWWNTYSSRPLPATESDYHKLPRPFHRYFEGRAAPN
jgi:D-cysteine desulfhydrase